jgi:uncharacterized protein YyaL (SSP411 family)
MYALAFARWHDPRHLAAARSIAGYLVAHLGRADGAFYVSQDADLDARTPGKIFYALDDGARRALGEPRVDNSVYPRENGWAARALVALYQASGETEWLEHARRAVAVLAAERRLPDGGFRHGESDRAGPYLADTLAMAEAYVRLAEVEPQGPWRARAAEAAQFIATRFADVSAGFVSAPVVAGADGVFARAPRLVEENVAVARLMRRLERLSHEARFGALADRAMRFLTSPTLLEVRPFSPGVLLADRAR